MPSAVLEGLVVIVGVIVYTAVIVGIAWWRA